MSEDNIKSVIEALLFSSDRPLLIEQIKGVLPHMRQDEIRTAVEELKFAYAGAERGIRIIEIAGGFQMATAADFAPFLKKLYKEKRVDRLSKPALETLAIIAYKQPITRVEIESLRSVNVDGMINNLAAKGLVRISGRRKAPGRPFVYSTTKHFLEYFGLKSLEELPKIEELSSLAGRQDLPAGTLEEDKKGEGGK